ncbi:hypothetical protein E8E11_007227 [Didymella keratinophila]|nr:hypothetical protein E8E11_007227 [Didymella keratinophila]
MDGKHTISARERKRDEFKTPNLIKPPAKAVTISAVAVFKRQKPNTPQLRSSSRAPLRSTMKRTAKNTAAEEVHPLALAFKESSEDYRRHLYSTAVTKINKDIDTFFNKLYDSNLQVVSSDPANNDSQSSPLKLTVPAKYQRYIEKLCNPLSSHQHSLQRTTSLDEIDRMQVTIQDRFRSFEEIMSAETEEFKNLQLQWEGAVADIFQLGMACLGEESIATLLSTAEPGAGEAESTLFVPEQGDSAHKAVGKRKRVSFAGPDMVKLFPGFLFQTPGQQMKPVPASPELPADEVQQLEQVIADLGKQHVADLQRLEKDHLTWWKKKQKQIHQAFASD